jgi:hypothetical protein
LAEIARWLTWKFALHPEYETAKGLACTQADGIDLTCQRRLAASAFTTKAGLLALINIIVALASKEAGVPYDKG